MHELLRPAGNQMFDTRAWRDPAVVDGDGIEPPTSTELAEHPPEPLKTSGFGTETDLGRPKSRSSAAPPAAHSRFILAATTTLLHFLTSSEISLAKSAGDPPRAVPPRVASRAWSFGSAMLRLTSLFSFSMISSGVRFGPPRPNHALAS